ncbi:MAG: hypothetical protein U0641_16560 [Anaerolineae bacterium]
MVAHAETFKLEADRRQALDDLIAENGEKWLKQYEPGSLGCHELLVAHHSSFDMPSLLE